MADIPVTVVYALPDAQWCSELEMPAGATVADLLLRIAAIEPFCGLDLAVAALGIYGERVTPARVLEPQDRLEIYRPLNVDPKTARRQRAAAASGLADAGK